MKNYKLLIVAAVLVAALIGLAHPIGIYLVSSDDPNSVEMHYGGTIIVSLVSSSSVQRQDPQDPNYIIVTTVTRQRISDFTD